MSKTTQTEVIRQNIADRIVHGLMKPGDSLDETQLAAEFQVSRTPIREAIRQLEAIGLAQSRPHRGAIVAGMSEQKLHEVFAVMAALEALCARLAASAMTGAERRSLQILHSEGAAAVRAGALEDYRMHNNLFHEMIYDGSHNGFLAEITSGVRLRLAPFRRAQFEAAGRLAMSHAEHAGVVEAIDRGDGEAAAAAMHAHILSVSDAADAVAHLIKDLQPVGPAPED